MTGAALALLLAATAGFPFARLLDRDAPLSRNIGVAMLLGIPLVALVLLGLGVTGVPWIAAVVLFVTALASLPMLLIKRPVRPSPDAARRVRGVSLAIDALTALTLIAYALFATLPPIHADFINNWGLKARTFVERGGLDRELLQHRWYEWIHPDYPPLVPLALDWMALLTGAWAERTFGLLHVATAAALLLVVRSLLREETNELYASLATLMLAPLAVAPDVGLADTPLAIYLTASVLFLRRGNVTLGAVFLGCAAFTKNEGLALIAVVAIAMLLDAQLRRRVLQLWPALAVAAPWLVIRSAWGLQTDLTQGSALARIAENAREPLAFVRLLWENAGGMPLFWLGVLLALVVGWPRERFALTVVALQLAFYLAAYLATPYDLDWHIRWSFQRLVGHLAPLAAFTAAVLVRPRELRMEELRIEN